MKIVRALWGNPEYVKNEIPRKPLFEDETVFVWGTENRRFLENMGYRTILVHEQAIDPLYNTHLIHFAHKLKAIKLADSLFDEYLFLDWDVTLAKEIDDEFYSKIRSGNNIQCPLYAYHGEYRTDVEKYHRANSSYTSDLDDFLIEHIANLEKYNWQLDNIKVLPCFCFFYSNGAKIGATLLEIMETHGVTACIEEFCLFLYCGGTLDEYISKYEPLVIRGKEKDKNLEGMTSALAKINTYIDSQMEKDIYLFHDLI